MTGFYWDDSRFVCDGLPLASLAAQAGTPLYVYSAALIRANFRALDASFGPYPHGIHYALKANSSLAIVRLLRELGAGADANSAGEIEVALRAGFLPPQIVFTGVGKTRAELERAITLGVKAINAESAGELARIDGMAQSLGARARVALRINPDIDAGTHPHISTGLHENKFGVPVDEALAMFRAPDRWRHLSLVAIHSHLGSQMTETGPIGRAAALVADVARTLVDHGARLEYVDVGGGLGISYDGRPVPGPAEYAAALLPPLRALGLPIVLEPGRAIVGPAGSLMATVVDVKTRNHGRRFAVLDTGMTELIRPALYGAYHRIEPLRAKDAAPVAHEIVGPLCESSDVVGSDRMMPPLEVDDLVVIRDTGAYGLAMASNYLRRPMPAEVMVDDGGWRLIRRRQTIDDLLSLEQ
ncbi:MAG TPA: diaminopimelate decarboxylase [Vicinamibacterales bacterium]|nr:diaminopimelate decarboxylase [Vicinamibacterales bacterium]